MISLIICVLIYLIVSCFHSVFAAFLSIIVSIMLFFSPLEQFVLYDLPMSCTNFTLYMFVSLTILGILLFLESVKIRICKIVSVSGWMCKGFSNSVSSIVINHVGLTGGRYTSLVILIFLTILVINILGLTPYAYTPTSHLSFTIFLSVAVITGCTVIGLTHYGVQFFAIFIPEGTPLILTPLLIFIESVSYIARAFSLGIRLGANIIAGHSLLVIISSFVSAMLSPLSGLVLSCPIGLLVIFALFLMELGVAILQAYVFMLLTTSYLHDGLYQH